MLIETYAGSLHPPHHGERPLAITFLSMKLQNPFTTSSIALSGTPDQKRQHRDPYALAQARQRKVANMARQEALKKQRSASLGDPVRGITTAFIQSLDTASFEQAQSPDQAHETMSESPQRPPSSRGTEQESHLNHYIAPVELAESLQYSRVLTEPLLMADRSTVDPHEEEEEAKRHQILHQNAEVAVARIVRLANGNSKDRTRANIQRCINAFGRHNTDGRLAPKAPSNVSRDPSLPRAAEKTPRAGPDTGSSEVQIAILTTKIRVLANHLEGQGRQDKVNKRNLRLLVHRRQKLLSYLRRKERGGERWQNLVETLGLTDGTWKGEISL